jgi:phosphatidate cytidylyltransferase
MVAKRIITGLLIGIGAGILVWLGDPWVTVAVCVVAALAAYEFYRIVKNENIQPLTWSGILFSVLFAINAFVQTQPKFFSGVSSWFTLTLLITSITVIPLLWLLFKQNREHAFINWGWTVAGVLYTGWLLSFYIHIRAMENGAGWLLLVLGCTALCDVFAYAVGSNLGKHPLASSISGGKTIEGSIGGLIASIIFAIVTSLLFNLPVNYWQMILAGVIIAIFAQLGDLVESLLKRNMKAKDTGDVLPGHGGILDRIDSHLLVAPVAYYLIILLNNQGWPPG